MKYCNLGKAQSSRIVMGCMRINNKELLETEKVVVEAMRSGVNTFDLADIYGAGDCERIFGVAIRDLGVSREDYIIQTKCGIHKREGKAWYDFDKEYILSCADASLRRLNTEYIDVLLLHRPDTLMEMEEVYGAFDKLKSEGKVRAFGVSNFSAMQMRMLKQTGIEIVANQVQFSLMHTALIDAGLNVNMYKDESANRAGDVLEYCRMEDVRLQAWSPMQYGFFEGVFVGNDKFPKLNAELSKLAEKYGCTPTTIATAWILRHPAKIQVVTGTTSCERMQQMCDAAEIELTKEEWYSLYLATGKKLP